MPVAASTPWPVIIVWVVAVLFARLAKQQKAPAPRRPLAPPDPEGRARSDMGDALQRAMEKLKQSGKIRAVGVSNYDREWLKRASDTTHQLESTVQSGSLLGS